MERLERQGHETPAADAAGLLLRIGFAVLVMAAPIAAIFSRRAFVVLVPVGAFLIFIAALLNQPGDYVQRLRQALLGMFGLICCALGVWVLASLVWTPFPGSASERAFRLIGNVVLATAVALALPPRMRTSNLHLMSIGAAVATVALVAVSLLGIGSFRLMSNPEAPTLGRAAIAISAMVWPAVSWTISRGRDHHGMILVGLCGIAIFASGSADAAVVLGTAMFVFLAARLNAARAARILAVVMSLIVILAPLLALLGRFAGDALKLGPGNIISAVGLWLRPIADAPVRLVTGHGFDTLYRARAVELVDPRAPAGLLSEVWYDLGILGVLILAVGIFVGIRSLARLVPHVAAAALAVSAAIFVFMIIDPTATQAWWLSVCVVVSIMMVAVTNGQHRTSRPPAVIASKRIKIGV